ncbi:hypothetical protein [Streptomyces sp. AS02]|uniref:hypothetical protein n=1 Tax=Streptomyces sp. AS02 TaxID=2938946 RepID=UPI0020213118|nr:hypothetical protein [Streptomyces sp. AS02]MCL8016322.1 hypothetical protein [Streptomyces sp. AS02]
MPRVWDESGRETDSSIRWRAFAFWALLTADLVAVALRMNTVYDSGDWPWQAICVVTALTYPCALLVFSTYPPGSRALSALKCTGQAAVVLVLLAWIAHGSDPAWVWIGVVVLSVSVAVGLLRAGRQVRAEEEAEERRRQARGRS